MQVVGAILVNNGEILCARRGIGKYEYVSQKFEFPGGKIEPGETPQQALHRELIEEMLVDIDIADMSYFDTVNHKYPDFEMTMKTFICPIANRDVTLTEHLEIMWLPVGEIDTLDWAPADWPIVRSLINRGTEKHYEHKRQFGIKP